MHLFMVAQRARRKRGGWRDAAKERIPDSAAASLPVGTNDATVTVEPCY
jgi:hypothetical protein